METKKKETRGRKTLDPSGKKRPYSNMTLAVPSDEAVIIKQKAANAGKSVSRYLVELGLNDKQEIKND